MPAKKPPNLLARLARDVHIIGRLPRPDKSKNTEEPEHGDQETEEIQEARTDETSRA
jgi:hypothetical protein